MNKLIPLIIFTIAFAICVADKDSYDMKCDGEKLETSKRVAAFQQECMKENTYTGDNTTCIIQCLFGKEEFYGDDKKPNEAKFLASLDKSLPAEIKAKGHTESKKCFSEHAAAVDNTNCTTSREFDMCITLLYLKLCVK